VERIRIVDITARHSGEAEEVLRKEDEVHTDEGHPEVQLADGLVVHVAAHLREPVVPAAENREDSAERKHVVEVRHNVIGILQHAVDARVRKHDAGDTTDREQENEPERP